MSLTLFVCTSAGVEDRIRIINKDLAKRPHKLENKLLLYNKRRGLQVYTAQCTVYCVLCTVYCLLCTVYRNLYPRVQRNVNCTVLFDKFASYIIYIM